jgi:hypothetical protein
MGFPSLHILISWDVRSRSLRLIISPTESQYVHPLPWTSYSSRISTGSFLSSEHRGEYLKRRSPKPYMQPHDWKCKLPAILLEVEH